MIKTERKINTNRVLRRQNAFKHGSPHDYYLYLFNDVAEKEFACLPLEMPSAEIQRNTEVIHAVSCHCSTLSPTNFTADFNT